MLYFAYGEDMNHARMKMCCSGSVFLGSAYLDGYTLVFDGQSKLRLGATANIIPEKSGRVWGGIWDITPTHLESLDRSADYPKTYQRETFKVRNPQTQRLNAIGYIRPPAARGLPERSYLSEILKGARDCGLPAEYVEDTLASRATLE